MDILVGRLNKDSPAKLEPKLRVCINLDSKLCRDVEAFMSKAHHKTAPPAVLELVRMGLAVYNLESEDDRNGKKLSETEETILKNV